MSENNITENPRTFVMGIGWYVGIVHVPWQITQLADWCLSTSAPWWVFALTVVLFAVWSLYVLAAFAAPCPFKHAMNRTTQMAYAMFIARRAGADLHVTNKRNGDMHITYTLKPCEPGKLTEVWE